MESIRVRTTRRKRLGEGPLSNHLQLVFQLSALLGLSPLKFEKGKSKFSYALASYSIFIGCISIYFGFLNLYYNFNIMNNTSLAYIALLTIPIYTGLQLASIIDAFSNPSEYGTLFEILKIVDTKLSAISVHKVLRLDWSTRLTEIFVIIIFIILAVTNRPNVSVLFMILGTTRFVLLSSQIVAICSQIVSRYELVVDTLHQWKDMPQNITNRIETLLDVNHQLSRIVNIFSSCYKLQLLVLATITFVYITSRLFLSIFHYVRDRSFTFISAICVVICYCIVFLRIIRCSSTIVKKSKDFDKILYQLMINDENNGLLDNMSASVSTYLIMLIQFGRPIVSEE
ncbi:Gustatory receptor 39 [Halyomorpha halys]|nr:Gustatory receptor 39 [Halyomorpha halys]